MNILDWRKGQGLTQAAMAEKCGVSQPTLSRIERGIQQPSLDAYLRIEKLTAGAVGRADFK